MYTGLDSNRLLTNVLSQIGLGYFFVFLLLGQSYRVQLTTCAVVLAGYWAWFVSYPVPDPLPWAASQSISDFSLPNRFAQQFAFNLNPAAEFDVKLFEWLPPHGLAHSAHPGGYTTLNFIPSAVTMLLGLVAGKLLLSRRPEYQKVRLLVTGGMIFMVLAVTLSVTVCPIVKKIWTPSWTLYSGAWVLWMLAGLYWLIDVKGWRRWTFPLVVVGMNSLAMYMMAMLLRGWVSDRLRVYLGKEYFAGSYAPTVEAVAVFAVLWLICFYLYRRKIFIRV
jgi:predicted acyltransferase